VRYDYVTFEKKPEVEKIQSFAVPLGGPGNAPEMQNGAFWGTFMAIKSSLRIWAFPLVTL
jgi:hypothetical protein